MDKAADELNKDIETTRRYFADEYKPTVNMDPTVHTVERIINEEESNINHSNR